MVLINKKELGSVLLEKISYFVSWRRGGGGRIFMAFFDFSNYEFKCLCMLIRLSVT